MTAAKAEFTRRNQPPPFLLPLLKGVEITLSTVVEYLRIALKANSIKAVIEQKGLGRILVIALYPG